MGVSIVIGGQYGSEGKGKVANYFANKFNADVTMRVGGTNSGIQYIGMIRSMFLKCCQQLQ